MHIATLAHRASGLVTRAIRRADGALVAEGPARAAAGLDPGPSGPDWLAPDNLARLGELPLEGIAPLDPADWRFLPPVPAPGKIIATGRNYLDHVREGQEIWARRGKTVAIPSQPTAFPKFVSALSGHGDPIPLPEDLDDVDYEIELAVVIGTPAHGVSAARALDHVAGYTICNDVGARGIQRHEMEGQVGIMLAKNFPGFGPMGPWLATADGIADPQALDLCLSVNGEQRQKASTADMIFGVADLVAWWSRMGLDRGDVILTGTPSGVALARETPQDYYLRSGDLVRAEISGIGVLENPVTRG